MPVHDWTRVDAGIFHAFHQQWIIALSNALNAGLLPEEYYALPEQLASGFGPDVLTLQGTKEDDGDDAAGRAAGTKLLLAPAKIEWTAETDMEFYRRKSTAIVVRHVSGDRVVAMIEIVSPGNKASRHGLRAFVEKAAELLDRRVQLLIVDVLPPGRRDRQGIHAAIWNEITGATYVLPVAKAFTVAAYESATTVRAYVRHLTVGEQLPEMPLFLEANQSVPAPLEATYQTAFAAMPLRWRKVLESEAEA